MGPRSWLNLCIVLASALMVACSSPGKPFSYKDLKPTFGPSTSPAQPVVDQDLTFSFTLRNTWNKPLTGVAWQLNETGGAPGTIASGTADIAAFGSSAVSSVFTGALPKGTHTYQVVVDPGNAVDEQDESNNTSATLTVLVADQDLAFSASPAPQVTWPGAGPASADAPTLTFAITNTPAAGVAGNSPAVAYTITRNGVANFGETPANGASASPVTVSTAGATVTINLPATNSAGTFDYTITLTPTDGDDSNTTNNSVTVTVVIPAGA